MCMGGCGQAVQIAQPKPTNNNVTKEKPMQFGNVKPTVIHGKVKIVKAK